MTQVQVAAAANMSQSYYAEIERGQKRLNYDTMTAIAAGLRGVAAGASRAFVRHGRGDQRHGNAVCR